MKRLGSKLTYANVIATLALFVALGGGAAWAAGKLGKNVVKSNNIASKAVKNRNLAANAVKNKNLAKNAVTAGKVKKGTLTRTQLKAGTLAGLQVAEALATNVPGFTNKAFSNGAPVLTPVPLAGNGALSGIFTPQTGKSYVLLAELRGNPTDAHKGSESEEEGHFYYEGCYASVHIFLNGIPTTTVSIYANADSQPPFNVEPVGSVSTPVGLLTPGVAQTITASAQGSEECGGGTTGNLRITVVELG